MTLLNETDDEKDAISETQYLLDIPSMRESIVEGMEEDLDECGSELEWWANITNKKYVRIQK